jgi:hypothetical protein
MRPFFGCIVVACLLLAVGGCPKNQQTAPTDQGMDKHAYAIMVRCYDRSVTVKTSPANIAAFLLDPDHWGGDSMGADKLDEPLLGNSFPFSVSAGGEAVKGRLVVIKNGPEDLYY